MKCFLGMDGGGSGSRWALLGADGSFLGRGVGPPIQVTTMGVGETAHTLAKLISAASIEGGADGPVVAVAGLAGAGLDKTRREIEAALGAEASLLGADRVRVVSDIEVAAAAALAGGPGVTLNCPMAIETDYQLYQVFGSLAAEQNYVLALLGAVSDRYLGEIQTVLTEDRTHEGHFVDVLRQIRE